MTSLIAGRLGNHIRPGTEVVGGFFRMCVLTAKALAQPFEWREFIVNGWFLMRVSLLPTIAVSIPETVLLIFTLNVLLGEFGAADVSGAGAGGTAICADLGARTIREEIDALEVLGIDPIHRLVVPRVVASTIVAVLLNSLVIGVGLGGGYLFSVYLQNVSSGAYLSTLTALTGTPEVVIAFIKAATFGLIAGLVGCYRGLIVRGGSKGLGTAVNETVVLCFIALFAVNAALTTIGVRFGTGR